MNRKSVSRTELQQCEKLCHHGKLWISKNFFQGATVTPANASYLYQKFITWFVLKTDHQLMVMVMRACKFLSEKNFFRYHKILI